MSQWLLSEAQVCLFYTSLSLHKRNPWTVSSEWSTPKLYFHYYIILHTTNVYTTTLQFSTPPLLLKMANLINLDLIWTHFHQT